MSKDSTCCLPLHCSEKWKFMYSHVNELECSKKYPWIYLPFFSLIIASGSQTPADKYMVTLLSPVVRQILKKDTKYWKTVMYTRACREILYMYTHFPSPFPERTALLHKPYNDLVIGKGNPIVIWIAPAVIKKNIKHGFNCYEGFSCL